jgi:hypothetical protein
MNHVIPKRRVDVRVHLASGECRRGSVFLDYIDVIHRGEQTLLDKFNDDYAWFALSDLRERRVDIVNRSHVLVVEPDHGLPRELVRKEDSPIFRREGVTISLSSGREISGKIAMDLPDEFSRVSDFLNFPQNFFAVDTDTGPVIVSKIHVVSLTPHERPPALPNAAEIEGRA